MIYIHGTPALGTDFAQIVREYNGPPIVQQSSPFVESNRLALIIGGAAALVLVAIIMIIAALRRKRRHQNTVQPTVQTDQTLDATVDSIGIDTI